MGKYVTVVICMPDDAAELEKVQGSLKALEPYRTAMSLDDEMTILELIEQHPDFANYIADDARRDTARIHAGLAPIINEDDSPSP